MRLTNYVGSKGENGGDPLPVFMKSVVIDTRDLIY